MYYFRARYYDPAVKRFIQEDPIGYAGGENLYAYVEGSPLESRDPSGLKRKMVDWSAGIQQACEAGCNGSGWGAGAGGGGGGLTFSRVYVDGKYTGMTVTTPLLGASEAALQAMAQQGRQPNLSTGDRHMDDPQFRRWIDENLANPPEIEGQPGYHAEVGGWCTKTGCTKVTGDQGHINIGPAPKGALFAYHSHPDVGKPAIGRAGVYAAFPSDADYRAYSVGGRAVNTYIFSDQQIARIRVENGSFYFDPRRDAFRRWK